MITEKDLAAGLKALRNTAFLKNGSLSVQDVLGAFPGELDSRQIAAVYDFMAAEGIQLEPYEPREGQDYSLGELAEESFGGAISEGDQRVLDLYEEDLADLPALSLQEERDLTGDLLSGDSKKRQRAATRLAEGNLRWVVQLARGFAGAGVPLSDLSQEGNLALWETISGYEGPEELGTLLEKNITGAMKELLKEQGAHQRSGHQMAALANRILDTVREMEEETGEAVSALEISRQLGIPESRVEELLRQSATAMKNAEK